MVQTINKPLAIEQHISLPWTENETYTDTHAGENKKSPSQQIV